ncbi:MAG: dTDP-glucose 4,6-dehydratase [Gammaproteobacteria bacterium]|nr:MAG: dTDP-glucose 4,6-dehydratase [Gammaproteobacteria bacterium]
MIDKTLNLEQQRILVTGVTGFIGSRIEKRLAQQGCEVFGIARTPPAESKHGNNYYQVDLSNLDDTRRIVKKIEPDIILNCAGHPFGDRSIDMIMPAYKHNFVASLNLLLAASEIDCKRIILPGSMETPIGEQAGSQRLSPYALSKWCAYEYGKLFYQLYQLPVITLRMFMVYGPGQAGRHMKKLIPYTISSFLQGSAPVIRSGKRQVDWIYIDDVVDATIAALEAGQIEGECLDIGSGEYFQVSTVVEQIAQIMNTGIKPVYDNAHSGQEGYDIPADTGATCQKIGWKARVDLKMGLEKTIEWHKRQLAA